MTQHDDESITEEDFVKLVREMHGWLAELMPAARLAVKMMNAKNNLIKRWVPGARRDD